MKKQTKPKNSLPAYEKPPVIEVVCGIAFKKIEQFKGPHLGLFWQKLRADYPACQHAPPLGFPPDPSEPVGKFELPLPRIWFINEKKNGLIQLQNDRFFYNWRKMHADEPYPHYQTVIKKFTTNLDIFQKFLEEEELGPLNPTECELTYINHILKGEGWETISDVHDVMPEIKWRSSKSRFLPKPLNIGWQALFALPEDKGSLHVKLDQVAHKIDRRPILRLEISAKGLGADKSQVAIMNWFELAHKWIVCGFADLTGTKIQETIWRRSEVAH
ncbi:MAG TPA: TIGR04255 family protein [Desulfobacterales bacterium]|nr:TIGR04255 family protein [Desulfobacterales bacterium]